MKNGEFFSSSFFFLLFPFILLHNSCKYKIKLKIDVRDLLLMDGDWISFFLSNFYLAPYYKYIYRCVVKM